MSSPFAHLCAACGVSLVMQKKTEFVWIGWLIFLAVIADCDYLFPSLRENDVRITHSLGFALTLSLLSLLVWFKRQSVITWLHSLLAASSHLLLDLLVGVTALPLLWPFSSHLYQFPFGILPSAGKPSLGNCFFWRNLFLEGMIFVPLLFLIYGIKNSQLNRWQIIGLVVMSLSGMGWAFFLSR